MRSKLAALPACAAALFYSSAALGAPTLTTLVDFNNTNANSPVGNLIMDAAGNLYGATTSGGGTVAGGIIYQVAAGTGTLNTLATVYSIGAENVSGLTFDPAGNLYGLTTSNTVYQVAAGSRAVSTVALLGGNGSAPQSGLISDAAGNLYGTASAGGASNLGTVFRVAAGTRAVTTLASFSGTGTDGRTPIGTLLRDAAGNLYGTTASGGPATNGGTVFKVALGSGTATTVATFPSFPGNGVDITPRPLAGVIADAAGNLYGTTSGGGVNGRGSVFKVAAGTNALSTLVSFDANSGSGPSGGLILDAAGDLFGTTRGGGASGNGTVFEVAAGTNALTTLVSFNGVNGANPMSALVADAMGNLYGTTFNGGGSGSNAAAGTVFKLSGAGFVTVPEPAAASLAGAGAVGLLGRRRRRR